MEKVYYLLVLDNKLINVYKSFVVHKIDEDNTTFFNKNLPVFVEDIFTL